MNEQEEKEGIFFAPNKAFFSKYFFTRLLLVWPGSWLYFSMVGGAICTFLGISTGIPFLPLILKVITAGIGAWYGGRWYCEAMNKAESGVGNKNNVQFVWFFVRPFTFLFFSLLFVIIWNEAALPNPNGLRATIIFIVASLGAWDCGRRGLRLFEKGPAKVQNGKLPSLN